MGEAKTKRGRPARKASIADRGGRPPKPETVPHWVVDGLQRERFVRPVVPVRLSTDEEIFEMVARRRGEVRE